MSIRSLFGSLLSVAIFLGYIGAAQAAVKVYNANADQGAPGDFLFCSAPAGSPCQLFGDPETVFGFQELADDGLGTVTLTSINIVRSSVSGPISLPLQFYGPGAFVFFRSASTKSISSPGVSTGPHGPSGTAPGKLVEWGVVSNWQITGFLFCKSSPVSYCNDTVGFPHGETILPP